MFKESLILVSLLFLFVACERVSEESLKTLSPRSESQMMVNAELAVANAEIQTTQKIHRLTVEIARSDEERTKGLMGRDSLPENHGMWFIFPANVQDSFWMKDTKMSLDLLFVNEEGRIVDIIANTIPFSTEYLFSQMPYRYVLEVNGGYAKTHGIEKGDKITITLN